jgi:hypothetical protein
MRGRFDRAVMADDGHTGIGQVGAAAAGAAVTGGDHRLAKTTVQAVDQHPRAAIGHAHPPTGRRNRADRIDQLQQLDLAGSDGPRAVEIDANGQSRRRFRCGTLSAPHSGCHSRSSLPVIASLARNDPERQPLADR